MGLKRMTQSLIKCKRVLIAASNPLTGDIPLPLKLRDDAQHSTLCDPNLSRDLTHREVRLAMQTQQYMSMVAEKGPPWL